MIESKRNIIFVIGISGTGKSTIARLLAKELKLPFFEGDEFHSEANIKKMSGGHPLNDGNRLDWLLRLNDLAKEHREYGCIIACSALKESYRKILQNSIASQVLWISLEGSFQLISDRLNSRKGHFMPPTLLQSQWDTFEPPSNAIQVSIVPSPEKIVEQILKEIP
ncbi:gluconokinase [Arenibacter certesii]|uniref:Gluconokinase n=1 Tax=Arenibacter certesii TaxID=228955 RepID=A0A918MND0_9FLAO|nr:gluconokinase [Arenibacter certesii]GGW43208.1 gluconokinase [Arenibacter certesii]